MKWIKRGLVYSPDGTSDWAKNSAMQPTPLLLDDGRTIRVFVGMRDDKGRSRVGFVDVDSRRLTRVLRVSEIPALDLGDPGTFDENGVVPCSVIRRDDEIWLYYAGYQLGQQVRFYVFSGLAKSTDGGETFIRHQRVPICERTDDELLFRVIHTMMLDDGNWRAWYGAGSEYTLHNGKELPNYNIRHAISPDGITLSRNYEICLDMEGEEYRIGRPIVIKHDGRYKMFYSSGVPERGYRLAYAESDDGIIWVRRHGEMGLDVSPSGWDSEMQLAGSIVLCREGVYMFYNGNNYGESGFGCAELDSW